MVCGHDVVALFGVQYGTLMLVCDELNKDNMSKRCALVIGLDGAKGDFVMAHSRIPREGVTGFGASCNSCNDYCGRPQSGPKYKDGFKWSTSPGWSSTLSGVDNHKHQVIYNHPEHIRTYWETSKAYPNFLQLATRAGLRAAAVGRPSVIGTDPNNIGLLDPIKPTILWNAEPVPTGHAGEMRNVDACAQWMYQQHSAPRVVFAHLDGLDQAGHEYGWESEAQRRAMVEVDEQAFRLLDATQYRMHMYGEQWLIIVTADHGGHDKTHGTVEETDSCIPFITNINPLGANARSWVEQGIEPRQFDACTTVCGWMGFPTVGQDGRNWLT